MFILFTILLPTLPFCGVVPTSSTHLVVMLAGVLWLWGHPHLSVPQEQALRGPPESRAIEVRHGDHSHGLTDTRQASLC